MNTASAAIAGVELIADVELACRARGDGAYGSRHNLEVACRVFSVWDVIAAVSIGYDTVRCRGNAQITMLVTT